MIIDRASPATQNGHDPAQIPRHDSNLQQAQTFFLLKYLDLYIILVVKSIQKVPGSLDMIYLFTTHFPQKSAIHSYIGEYFSPMDPTRMSQEVSKCLGSVGY